MTCQQASVADDGIIPSWSFQITNWSLRNKPPSSTTPVDSYMLCRHFLGGKKHSTGPKPALLHRPQNARVELSVYDRIFPTITFLRLNSSSKAPFSISIIIGARVHLICFTWIGSHPNSRGFLFIKQRPHYLYHSCKLPNFSGL